MKVENIQLLRLVRTVYMYTVISTPDVHESEQINAWNVLGLCLTQSSSFFCGKLCYLSITTVFELSHDSNSE